MRSAEFLEYELVKPPVREAFLVKFFYVLCRKRFFTKIFYLQYFTLINMVEN